MPAAANGPRAAAFKTRPTGQLSFLAYIYQRQPSAINVTTFGMTRDIVSKTSHPLYTQINRRFAAFNADVLHWNVVAPLDLSKKAVVRSWAKRRVRDAFMAELKSRGWDGDGSRTDGTNHRDLALKGALSIRVLAGKEKAVLTASGEEVRSECAGVLENVLQQVAIAQRKENRATISKSLDLRDPG